MSSISILHDSYNTFFRNPFGAVPCGEKVILRLQVETVKDISAVLLKYRKDGEEGQERSLTLMEEREGKKIYEFVLETEKEPCLMWYYFLVICGNDHYYYGNATGLGGPGGIYDFIPPSYQITVFKRGVTTPAWFKNAVMYQIFVDRFYNGCKNGKILNPKKNALLHLNWDDDPVYLKDKDGKIQRWTFFGGNLLGVRKKLPYLKALGIDVIYFNPVFEAASNHKYDTGDYHKIDPMFGDNELFEELCAEAKEMGISIILDGVFSHTGSDSIYFNKEGNYDSVGAYQSPDSPYYKWYSFITCNDYACWWQIDTLPNVNELEPSYQDFIIYNENSVLKFWMKKGIKGWRLDVVDELPDRFIKNFRKELKKIDEDAVLIGEVWEDASNKESYGKRREYLLGDEVDSVMNYPFREALLGFMSGEKSAHLSARILLSLYENYPRHHFYSMMNLLDSHDVERVLTVMKKNLPDVYDDAFKQSIGIARLKLLVLWQMAFPGVPAIYYGDEAGLEGGKDPLNRRTYPWGKENKDLLKFYKRIIALRKHYDVLRTGYWLPIPLHGDVFVFIRYFLDGKDAFGEVKNDNFAVVLLNRSLDETITLSLDLFAWGKAEKLIDVLNDYHEIQTENGRLTISLSPLEGKILLKDRWQSSETEKRRSGILLHVTSLPSRYGIGDIGKGAYDFIDFLAESKQKLWQVLPLHPVGYGNSPYSALSAFAGNPLLIDPRGLVEEGYLKADEVLDVPFFLQDKAEYERVSEYKERLLRKAFLGFNKSSDDYLEFIETHKEWLDDYALFLALKMHFQGAPWHLWEKELAERKEHALIHYRKLLAEEIAFNKFVQYIFYSQWAKLRSYAHEKGIKIVGDIPLYVAHDSADVWAFSHLFEVDALGRPAKVAGVPPDYFSKTGQRWGNPLYKWDEMAKDEYSWWVRRIRHELKSMDILRIDHFRGFEKYWAIPAGSETAVNGEWVEGPGEKFFKTVEKNLGKLPVIAEDLGFITPEVDDLKNRFGFPGMKILHFELENGKLDIPLNEKNTVLYTGSHDNDTTVGWYKKNGQYTIFGLANNEEIAWHFIDMAYRSDAETVIIPLQDVLALDSSARMNTPGTTEGNWEWRFKDGMLSQEISAKLAALTKKYHR